MEFLVEETMGGAALPEEAKICFVIAGCRYQEYSSKDSVSPELSQLNQI
jgi:hypothetical protein